MHCKRENGLGCAGHRSLLCLYPSWLIFHYFVLLCLLLELDGTGPELYNSGLLTHVSDLIWLHEGPISSFKHHVPHPAHFDIRWTRSVKFPCLSAWCLPLLLLVGPHCLSDPTQRSPGLLVPRYLHRGEQVYTGRMWQMWAMASCLQHHAARPV